MHTFDPSGYPDKPPASYQIKPTTVWVVPSSTSDTRLLGARGDEERRGGLGPVGITPFPLPAHQTGRADFPHPASRPASPQSTRRGAKMDPTSSDHTEFPCHRASIHPVTQINRLPATRSNRQLSGWFLPPLVIRAFWAHVESRRGAVAWALWASLRFLSPLIKPDVRISRIRLPDRLHLKAHGGGPRWTRRSRITPSSPNTTLSGKRLVPRDDTLWRLTRK